MCAERVKHRQWLKEWGGGKPTVIYPIQDLRKHDLLSRHCWCEPEIERYDDEGTIIKHRSLDRREDYEEGWRKPC